MTTETNDPFLPKSTIKNTRTSPVPLESKGKSLSELSVSLEAQPLGLDEELNQFYDSFQGALEGALEEGASALEGASVVEVSAGAVSEEQNNEDVIDIEQDAEQQAEQVLLDDAQDFADAQDLEDDVQELVEQLDQQEKVQDIQEDTQESVQEDVQELAELQDHLESEILQEESENEVVQDQEEVMQEPEDQQEDDEQEPIFNNDLEENDSSGDVDITDSEDEAAYAAAATIDKDENVTIEKDDQEDEEMDEETKAKNLYLKYATSAKSKPPTSPIKPQQPTSSKSAKKAPVSKPSAKLQKPDQEDEEDEKEEKKPAPKKKAPSAPIRKAMTWEDCLRRFYPSYNIPTHAASHSFVVLHDLVAAFFAPLEGERKRASRGTVRVVPVGREKEFVKFIKDGLDEKGFVANYSSSDDEEDEEEDVAVDVVVVKDVEMDDDKDERENEDADDESDEKVVVKASSRTASPKKVIIVESEEDSSDDEEEEVEKVVKKCSVCSAAKTPRWCDGQTEGYEIVCLGCHNKIKRGELIFENRPVDTYSSSEDSDEDEDDDSEVEVKRTYTKKTQKMMLVPVIVEDPEQRVSIKLSKEAPPPPAPKQTKHLPKPKPAAKPVKSTKPAPVPKKNAASVSKKSQKEAAKKPKMTRFLELSSSVDSEEVRGYQVTYKDGVQVDKVLVFTEIDGVKIPILPKTRKIKIPKPILEPEPESESEEEEEEVVVEKKVVEKKAVKREKKVKEQRFIEEDDDGNRFIVKTRGGVTVSREVIDGAPKEEQTPQSRRAKEEAKVSVSASLKKEKAKTKKSSPVKRSSPTQKREKKVKDMRYVELNDEGLKEVVTYRDGVPVHSELLVAEGDVEEEEDVKTRKAKEEAKISVEEAAKNGDMDQPAKIKAKKSPIKRSSPASAVKAKKVKERRYVEVNGEGVKEVVTYRGDEVVDRQPQAAESESDDEEEETEEPVKSRKRKLSPVKRSGSYIEHIQSEGGGQIVSRLVDPVTGEMSILSIDNIGDEDNGDDVILNSHQGTPKKRRF